MVPDPPNVIEHYDAVFSRLAGAGPCAVAEAPAFGFSSPRGRFGFSVRDMARTLVELLEALGFHDATLSLACVGSFGALRAAAARPDLVGRLVLSQVASHRQMIDWVRREDVCGIIQTPVLGQLALAAGGRFVARRWYGAALPERVDPGPWAAPALAALHGGAGFPLASAFQVFARDESPLPPVRQPVTVLFGTADPTHRETDHGSARLLAERVEVVCCPRSGHFPDLEDAELWLSCVGR